MTSPIPNAASVFNNANPRQLTAGQPARPKGHGLFRNGESGMSGKWVTRVVVLVYLIIGIFIAWDHGYLTLSWLRTVASAILAILLWWLIPLGVNLHIHG
jgi:hypothetical protein